jgi:uncharacterized membrane protein
MLQDDPRATVTVVRRPIHSMLVPFPIVCFVGVFFTDLAYWKTLNVMWERFSIWLLVVGLIMAALAIVAGLIDFIFSRQARAVRPAWLHVIGTIVVLALSVLNAFVHSRDAYTAVVPQGIILSGIVFIILLITGWMGWGMVYHQRVGVSN